MVMKQDERWLAKYNEVLAFKETNHRNTLRHRVEEPDMLNWVKANGKKMNVGEMNEERVGMFQKLLALCEEYRRVNQYV